MPSRQSVLNLYVEHYILVKPSPSQLYWLLVLHIDITYLKQWCSRDSNLRDRDLAQISRRDRDRDFVMKAKTETWKFETETRDLTFL